MADLATFAVEHGTALVALITSVTAMARARARREAASAGAVEELTREHARCRTELADVRGRIERAEERVDAADKRASEMEGYARTLDAELKRLMKEIGTS